MTRQIDGPLAARCPVPGSKSESNRALVLAALSSGPSTLTGVLVARDTQLMIAGLRQMGVEIQADHTQTRVTPPLSLQAVPGGIDCGLAGTVMRFLPPLAALAPGTTRFTGDPQAAQRPIQELLAGLRQLGVLVDNDSFPFTMTAPKRLGGPHVSIDASASSQFVSGLLLCAARLPHGIQLSHTGRPLPSLPHIQMTVAMLQERGVVAESNDADWTVAPGPIAPLDQRIEPDLTNAAAFLIAGVLSGGWVQVPGWPAHTRQPGNRIIEVLEAFGARTVLDDDGLTAFGDSPVELHGVDLDLHDASELTPVVAALGVFATGTTTIGGVAHIRGHETDRLTAIETELAALGVNVHQNADGLVIQGRGRDAQLVANRQFGTYADHRMAHLGALLGLLTPRLRLADAGVVTKTMPDFFTRWDAMLDSKADAC